MKVLATSLLAAVALAGGVAHADSASFRDPHKVPFQSVQGPRGAAAFVASTDARLIQPSSGQTSATSIAGGDDSDDAGRTMLATGDDDDTRTQLA